MPRGIADIVQIVVLAAGANAFLRRGRTHIVAIRSTPVNKFLNWTIPELVNISVGSLRGTSGELTARSRCP